MKSALYLAAAAIILASASCAKHSWEETQVLHEGMHQEHHDEHGKADSHGKADAHGEAKPHGEAPHGEAKKAEAKPH